MPTDTGPRYVCGCIFKIGDKSNNAFKPGDICQVLAARKAEIETHRASVHGVGTESKLRKVEERNTRRRISRGEKARRPAENKKNAADRKKRGFRGKLSVREGVAGL